ncbi:LOB domain-containing protein 38 [Acorus calamus]|uniref:LOB domain-containing protein 38 n=1 Tax=Acorus calamus TaxID=4465 RepID=A0AAV9ESE5_ACOCL|nr:LOB domain-containing protein 38 [Acorus calamus]
MSCNGCRVLRKGCSENCLLRPCLQWIDGPEAQGHATVFVAKFFGRAGLMSFISAVPESQRPGLFQSLLFEACGRTVNPVNGAVGLLWTGNWHVCQAAVQTVLRGGALKAIPDIPSPGASDDDDASEVSRGKKRMKSERVCDPDLGLMTWSLAGESLRRPTTPSRNSEGSVTTSEECGGWDRTTIGADRRLLNLFV